MLQSFWSGSVCLVLPVAVWLACLAWFGLLGAVWLVCLVWFDLLGTACCSLIGLFNLVWLAWYCLLQSDLPV
jgi:hypothetical protein